MSTWDTIIGHSWARETLRQSVANDRIGHAYLITGPRQIGKTKLARTFAQAVNCVSGDISSRPCGRCRACRLIEIDRHPDIVLIEGPADRRGKQTIKIDQIRQLQRKLTLTATEARYKIAIFDRFENATTSAANAFLKTLEEPPSRVILILTAVSAEAVLPTIASRCRVFPLRPLQRKQIETALIDRFDVPPKEAVDLAHLSDGRIGWAISAWQDPQIMDLREDQVSFLYDGIVGGTVDRFKISETITKDPENLMDLLGTWLSWWRDLSLVMSGMVDYEMITNISHLDEIIERAENWTLELALASLRRTEKAIWQIEHNANTRLVVENLLLAYP